MTYSSRRRSLVLAGTFVTSLVAAWPAAAQQPAPLPPGSPLIGRPDTPGAQKLAPVPAPPLAAAADKLPLDKLKAPKRLQDRGLCQRRCPTPARSRSATRAPSSSARGCRTRSMPSSTRAASARRRSSPRASTGRTASPSKRHALHHGAVPALEDRQVEDKLDNPPKPTVILSDLPKDEAHGWKYLAIGPDNKLYFQIGQPCNNCLPPERLRQDRRVNLDGNGMEIDRARASATPSASTGIRSRRNCISPTTAATGCRRTSRTTSSTA